jgi:hypothetical protein
MADSHICGRVLRGREKEAHCRILAEDEKHQKTRREELSKKFRKEALGHRTVIRVSLED